MSTKELIRKLGECIVKIMDVEKSKGDEKAEKCLRRLQFLWYQERPFKWHTLN